MRAKVTLDFSSQLLRQPELLRSALENAVRETAFDVERDIKERMREPKHGRTYARGAITRRASKTTRGLGLRERTSAKGNRLAIVGSKLHRASKAGEAPAVDLGELINSILTSGRGLKWSVGSPLEKAALLEGGTVRIRARPAFGPAAERAQAPLQRTVDEAVGRLI
ncbi:MAG: hypothetical protein ABW208_10185 [Pyrinomonadaceae bacterium]